MSIGTATAILFITLAGVLVMSFILSAYALKKHFELREQINDLTRYSINVAANIDQSIPELLDLLINESFADWQTLNTSYKDISYITDDIEKEMRDGLTSIVQDRLSGPMMDKLSLYYNAQTLAKIIAEKIYIVVMSYVVNNNRSSEEASANETKRAKELLPNEGLFNA